MPRADAWDVYVRAHSDDGCWFAMCEVNKCVAEWPSRVAVIAAGLSLECSVRFDSCLPLLCGANRHIGGIGTAATFGSQLQVRNLVPPDAY
jgi:hypothetical protein